MTKDYIARGHRPSSIEPLVIPRTKEQMFQSIAPETIKSQIYYLIPYQESVFLYVSKTLPSPNYLYLYCMHLLGLQ